MAPPKLYKVGGGWKGKSAGGCLNYPSWRFNPQLFLSVDKKRTVKISLNQEPNETGSYYHIGFYVAISDGTGRRQLTLTQDKLVGKAVFSDEPTVEIEVTFSSTKTYVVIPCTFKPAQEGKFSFSFSCSGALKISPLPPNREWKCVTGKGEWKGKTAGGCRNHPTCVQNPQFLIKTRKATTAIILLSQLAVENFDAIGFYIVTAKSSKSKITKIRNETLVAKSDFGRGYEACYTLNLEAKKKYSIIPSTFDPGNESSFSITIFSEYDVRLKPLKDSKEVSISSEWTKEEAGGCINYPTWRNNPQYFLIMDKKATITITLEQSGNAIEAIGFYLVKGEGNRVVILKRDSIIEKGEFQKERSVTVKTTLDKAEQPYVIIPCSFNAGVEMKFQLSVCVDQVHENNASSSRARASKVLQLVPCSSEWRRKFAQGFWIDNFRGGCSLEENRFLSNPQFLLSLSGKSKLAIVLHLIQSINTEIGFYVLKVAKGTKNLLTLVNIEKDLIENSPFNSDCLESVLEIELEGGDYVIIPATKLPDCSGEFELSVYIESDIEEDFVALGEDSSFVKQKGHTIRNLGEAKWSDIVLGKKIGQGGFGIVYHGTWKGRTVAVKKLFCEEMEVREYESFQMEIEIMSKLRHKNILACLGASLDAKESFILTEFMARGNMSDVLEAEPNLDWKTKIKMALDAAEGMNYLHSLSPPIVHRDLKSLNLLVDEKYTVKVADFGLSKATTGKSLNSKVGSLNWCPPEILLKRMAYTPKSDVYSFGMVLYELTTHHPPFKGLNPIQVLRAIDQGDLPKLPKDTNEELAQLIEDCWKTEPEDRPDFEEIVRRLKQLSEIIPIGGSNNTQ